MLAINAKTAHAAAAWKLIQYLTSPPVEIARAEVTGDPPSLPSAYTSALYAKAPYFQNVKMLNAYSPAAAGEPELPDRSRMTCRSCCRRCSPTPVAGRGAELGGAADQERRQRHAGLMATRGRSAR